MTWTAEQERAHRQAAAERRRSQELVQTWFNNFPGIELGADEAADIILHADALIALLQPFASAPEPERAHVEDADGWIENDGVMPVAGSVCVDVKFVNGKIHLGKEACRWYWPISDDPGNITHWRLHKPQESRA